MCLQLAAIAQCAMQTVSSKDSKSCQDLGIRGDLMHVMSQAQREPLQLE